MRIGGSSVIDFSQVITLMIVFTWRIQKFPWEEGKKIEKPPIDKEYHVGQHRETHSSEHRRAVLYQDSMLRRKWVGERRTRNQAVVGGSFARRRQSLKYPEGSEIGIYPKDSFINKRWMYQETGEFGNSHRDEKKSPFYFQRYSALIRMVVSLSHFTQATCSHASPF